MPDPENYMQECFLDASGCRWFGSPPNNKVGYFIVSGRLETCRVSEMTIGSTD
jgi:hypothetical protein